MNPYFMLKALHLVSMVAWFAGLFYIFRLFVYHRIKYESAEVCALLSLMEGRLLKAIVLPASIATTGFGAWLLIYNPQLIDRTWIRAKLCLVLLLFAYQGLTWVTWRRFSSGSFFLSERACRLINELPTILLIGIVFLAVLKPWG